MSQLNISYGQSIAQSGNLQWNWDTGVDNHPYLVIIAAHQDGIVNGSADCINSH